MTISLHSPRSISLSSVDTLARPTTCSSFNTTDHCLESTSRLISSAPSYSDFSSDVVIETRPWARTTKSCSCSSNTTHLSSCRWLYIAPFHRYCRFSALISHFFIFPPFHMNFGDVPLGLDSRCWCSTERASYP